MGKIIIIEGYSLDSIEFYLYKLDSLKEEERLDAYQRLCKVALCPSTLNPGKAERDILYSKINRMVLTMRKEEKN